jgi:hypothetical protein
MTFQLEKTPWLPPAPADFSQRCKALAAAENGGALAANLASFALSANQCATFARALKKARAITPQMPPLSNFRLGVLASFTADLLLDCVPAAGARHGVLVDLVTTPYDQIFQQALDPQSVINCAQADGVLLLADHRWFKLESPSFAHADARIDDCARNLADIVDALSDYGGAVAILCTVPPPPEPLFGSYDEQAPGSPRRSIAELNRNIRELAQRTGSYLLDLAAVAERVGTDVWFDAVQWSAYKLPFSATLNPVVADHIGRLLGAIRGNQMELPEFLAGARRRALHRRRSLLSDASLGARRLSPASDSGRASHQRLDRRICRARGGATDAEGFRAGPPDAAARTDLQGGRAGSAQLHQVQKPSDCRGRSGEDFARTEPGAPARDYATDLS